MSYLGIPPFGQTVRTVTTITATASQTIFTPTGGYTVGYCDVFYNGIKLVGGTDFTATDGLTVVLTAGATSGAVVEIITYGTVTITDAVRRSGDTFSGAVAINSTLAAGNTTITGNTTTTTLNSGNTAITGTLAAGNTTITGTANVSGAATFSNTVSIAGNVVSNVTFSANTTHVGAAAFSNTITVTGNATFSNTIAIGSDYLSPYVGFRNKIINGAMTIDQRAAGANTTATSSDSYLSCDRWNQYSYTSSKYKVGQNLNSVTPPAGFSNYLGVQSVGAYSPISTDVGYYIQQRVEGFNAADLAWGTASAKPVTISFWVQSSKTGNWGGSIYNGTSSVISCPFTYTISSANTWEYKTITIPGCTIGSWNTSNQTGFVLLFGLGTGTNYSGGTNLTWANNGSNSYFTLSAMNVLVDTNNATWYLTGVQLEKGSTATPFDYRPYGTELQLCQRYYQKSYDIETAVGTATRTGYINWNWGTLTQYATVTLILPVNMRANPTVTNYNPDLTNTVGGRYWNGSAEVAFTGSLSGWNTYRSNITFNMDGTSRSNMLIQWTASAEL